MANRLRFRSGAVELHRLRVDSATVIEAGDMVYLDTDDVKPASSFTWTTDLPTTQGAFAAVFLGIAHQQSASGATDPLSVELPPHSVLDVNVNATYEAGDVPGPDATSAARPPSPGGGWAAEPRTTARLASVSRAEPTAASVRSWVAPTGSGHSEHTRARPAAT